MKKLKDLLKESFVWERQFGEKLPTLDSIQKKHNEKKLTEVNFEKVKLPATVDRFLNKFVESWILSMATAIDIEIERLWQCVQMHNYHAWHFLIFAFER